MDSNEENCNGYLKYGFATSHRILTLVHYNSQQFPNTIVGLPQSEKLNHILNVLL